MAIPSAKAFDSMPGVEEIIANLPYKETDLDRLLTGEIVTYDLEEGNAKELAITVALLIAAPLNKLVDFVLDGRAFRTSEIIVDVHILDNEPPREGNFTTLGFTESEADETSRLARVAPGATFNLAPLEIQRLNALSDKSRLAINREYRAILLDRYKAYREGGLNGISPYDRGNGIVIKPGEELRDKAARQSLMKEIMPGFHRALLNYPGHGRDDIHNQFALVKKLVADRPAFSLGHRMYQIKPDAYAVQVYREFYVGHSYHSQQIIVAAFQVQGGTLVFYGNRTSTDQVAGFGSGIKHKLGRGMMRKTVIKHFEAIRQTVQQGTQ